MAIVNHGEQRGRVVLRAPGLGLVWCGLLVLVIPAGWLYVLAFDWNPVWFWASVPGTVLVGAAILRRRVIVDDDRVVIQDALRRRERSIHDVVQVDLVAYDGFWGWSESPLADLLNPFAYLDSPLLVLVADEVGEEIELRGLAGTNRSAGRRAHELLGAIRAGGGRGAEAGTGLLFLSTDTGQQPPDDG
ncbi:MAG: hypothetical protein CVT65_02810 [Actinobacteria bacterium HGW-Actinobacteria-5]|jgi:hypothetical protein|nr:MAG: hypothetical protein CVT65_02810 [Actinobacteria bacterium HGW-Actinobacteria-5]